MNSAAQSSTNERRSIATILELKFSLGGADFATVPPRSFCIPREQIKVDGILEGTNHSKKYRGTRDRAG